MTTRYASWCDVLDYCRRSANPVGRLVLRIAGYRDEIARSIRVMRCARALQLTNFWQDFWARLARGPIVRATGGPGRMRCRTRRSWRAVERHRPGRARSNRAWIGYAQAVRRRTCRVRRSAWAAAPRAAIDVARRCFEFSSVTELRSVRPVRAPTVPRHHRRRVARVSSRRAGCRTAASRDRKRPVKTSFYYAFLVLPAEQRRAVVAVWRFLCRAVDDARRRVSRERLKRPSSEAVCFWRAELARCFQCRAAADPARSWAAAVHRAVWPAASGVRRR